MKKNVITVVGARPQLIKASVVTARIKESDFLHETIIHTGQHFDKSMSDVFINQLNIPKPEYNLNINGGSHGVMTGRMLEAVEKVLFEEIPDAVLVYGDTNSTIAAALAAVKLHIPVAHVEAGLRSGNMLMPEEINRMLTDRISTWLFTPTIQADRNLLREGFDEKTVMRVGDVMFDLALLCSNSIGESKEFIDSIGIKNNEYVLVTIHRAENTDDERIIRNIVDALNVLSKKIEVVWPVHPRTNSAIEKSGVCVNDSLKILGPVGYLEMVELEKNSAVIVTDSGGVQKEAYFHKIPCVTLRNETEWLELVDARWNILLPPDSPLEEIVENIMSRINCKGEQVSLYGDGSAADKIVSILEERI